MKENEKDNGFITRPNVCLGNPGYGKSPPTNEKARTKDGSDVTVGTTFNEFVRGIEDYKRNTDLLRAQS